MYTIKQSSKFKKDLKRYSHDKEKLIALNEVIKQLEENGTVSEEYYPHPLKGDYVGTMECHIQSDFLLIWIDQDTHTIKLVRLGSHSELFSNTVESQFRLFSMNSTTFRKSLQRFNISNVRGANGWQRCHPFFFYVGRDIKSDLFVSLCNMNILLAHMLSKSDPSQVAGLSRFFKTGPGQYGEGDKFLGIKVPVTRSVVKECWKETGWDELEECIRSGYHEIRLAALLTLVQIFSHAKKNQMIQKRCVDFYLSHTEYINNWDLVDLSCYEILGRWLLDKDRTLLYDLAGNGRTIWEKRIGIVSTMQFIRSGELDDTYAIAEIFLNKPQPIHDLLQKAVGWMLREAGKRDVDKLRSWLDINRQRMPRTMLRYAIEKFPEEERKALMRLPESFNV